MEVGLDITADVRRVLFLSADPRARRNAERRRHEGLRDIHRRLVLCWISAVTGYISRGVTIKELALAAIGLVILSLVTVQMKFNTAMQFTTRSIFGLAIALAVVACLSLVGAWFGEILQKVVQSKGPESN